MTTVNLEYQDISDRFETITEDSFPAMKAGLVLVGNVVIWDLVAFVRAETGRGSDDCLQNLGKAFKKVFDIGEAKVLVDNRIDGKQVLTR